MRNIQQAFNNDVKNFAVYNKLFGQKIMSNDIPITAEIVDHSNRPENNHYLLKKQ